MSGRGEGGEAQRAAKKQRHACKGAKPRSMSAPTHRHDPNGGLGPHSCAKGADSQGARHGRQPKSELGGLLHAGEAQGAWRGQPVSRGPARETRQSAGGGATTACRAPLPLPSLKEAGQQPHRGAVADPGGHHRAASRAHAKGVCPNHFCVCLHAFFFPPPGNHFNPPPHGVCHKPGAQAVAGLAGRAALTPWSTMAWG